MAAPTPTVRQTPGGIKLDDGFSTKYTFAADPDLEIWEKSVTPPGYDGGDAIDTSTMWNTKLRTFNPRKLMTMTEGSFEGAYDPTCYTSILALINVETTVTVTFPDGSTVAFFGYLKTFKPNACEDGTQPTAACTIQPTNQDSSGAEQDPVVTSVAGT